MRFIELTDDNIAIHALVEAEFEFQRKAKERKAFEKEVLISIAEICDRSGKSRNTIKKELEAKEVEPADKQVNAHYYRLTEVREAIPSFR